MFQQIRFDVPASRNFVADDDLAASELAHRAARCVWVQQQYLCTSPTTYPCNVTIMMPGSRVKGTQPTLIQVDVSQEFAAGPAAHLSGQGAGDRPA